MQNHIAMVGELQGWETETPRNTVKQQTKTQLTLATGIRSPEALIPDPGVAIPEGRFKPLGLSLGVAGSACGTPSLTSNSSRTTI